MSRAGTVAAGNARDFMDIRLNPFHRGDDAVRDLRKEMIAETGAFLTWALAKERGLPAIPRRRVDEGGFTRLLTNPGARALVSKWWSHLLDSADSR